MKEKLLQFFFGIVFLAVAVLFVAVFGGPTLLQMYIKNGIGDCKTIPVLCMAPQADFTLPVITDASGSDFIPYRYDDIELFLPKGFTVVKEQDIKVYYKRKHKATGATVYLLYEPPGFFVNLFTNLKKAGIKNDYDFLCRVMQADLEGVKDLTDAFFVITKGIFIPDLGDQKTVKMAQFVSRGKKGFINYNFTPEGNFFDCNFILPEGGYVKIYLKDKMKVLDLDKVFVSIATVKKSK